MDLYDHQSHRQRSSAMSRQSASPRHRGKRLTEEQVRLLEKSFTSNKKLDPERKLRLAGELGVPPRQVAIWYQNKRARWKTQTLEVDYSTLQVRLDSALAEKAKLQRDVEKLRAELGKTRDILALAGLREPDNVNNNNNSNNNVIFPSSCSNNFSEEGGGSSTTSNNSFSEDHHRVSCSWEVDENKNRFQLVDDLYACVMFASQPARSDY